MAKEYAVRVREDGIVVFYIPDLTQEHVDWWMEDLARMGQTWTNEEIALLFFDVSGSVPTPYLKGRLGEVSDYIPAPSQIRTAFLVGGSFLAFWRTFLQELGPLLGEKAIFTHEDEAIHWLLEVL
jgi:hypothetical protein